MQIEIPKPNGKADVDYLNRLTDVLQLYVNMTHNELQTISKQIEKENKNGIQIR